MGIPHTISASGVSIARSTSIRFRTQDKERAMSEQQFAFLATLAERMHSTAAVSMIYGAPLEAHGKVIIPVARIAYGLGGGYSTHAIPAGSGQGMARPRGESGGGGIIVAPLGILEVTPEQTRFVPLHSRRATWVGAALGSVVGVVVYALLRKTH
jgi:uncharacterized spore protein YtfJ